MQVTTPSRSASLVTSPSHRRPVLRVAIRALVAVLLILSASGRARAEEEAAAAPDKSNLVKQANAPISTILQVRLQNTYLPEFQGVDGDGNTATLAITMPLPAYRILPVRQISLLSVPAAVTTPDNSTGFGDLRFTDLAIFDIHHRFLCGVGLNLVFPSASLTTTGQGKWQAGPAALGAFFPGRWLFGVLAQNPVSFAGDGDRKDANALFLQPFLTYQFDGGWFLRSQSLIVFNWESHGEIVPLDLGVGRVFRIGSQNVNLFVEPFWNASTDGPSPKWGVTVGFALLYPNFWETP